MKLALRLSMKRKVKKMKYLKSSLKSLQERDSKDSMSNWAWVLTRQFTGVLTMTQEEKLLGVLSIWQDYRKLKDLE
jgi:hypothetical protein